MPQFFVTIELSTFQGNGNLPLYEYQCTACRHRFEVLQRFSDPQVTACPRCGGEVQQLFSPPAVRFKGSGWYATDYARKSGGDGAKKLESKSDTKSESTPAKKSEEKK